MNGNRIVVGCPPGGLPDHALASLARWVRIHDGEMLVLGVGTADEDPTESVDRAVAALAESGLRAEREVLPLAADGVAATIAVAAEVWKADFVALGSDRRDVADGHLVGRVPRALVRRTTIPLFVHSAAPGERVVQDGAELHRAALGRVVIAIDESANAGAALRAASLLSRQGTPMLVLHVLSETGSEGARRADASAAGADRLLRQAVATLEEAGHDASSQLVAVPDRIAEAIAAKAETWGADLVLLGAPMGSRPGCHLVDGTAADVLRHTPRPVMLVVSPCAAKADVGATQVGGRSPCPVP
ncbi:MAG: universal stress protein [Candidatus Dormiibacterota bacterium]